MHANKSKKKLGLWISIENYMAICSREKTKAFSCMNWRRASPTELYLFMEQNQRNYYIQNVLVMWNDVGNNYSHLRNPDLTKEYGSPANFKKNFKWSYSMFLLMIWHLYVSSIFNNVIIFFTMWESDAMLQSHSFCCW